MTHAFIGSPALWGGFVVFILALVAIDLLAHRQAHRISLREAAAWSTVWVAVSLAFALLVYVWFGSEPALAFLTGYVIEKSLSVDNLFVFLVLFNYFAVPAEYQHRVLTWGVLGAMVMRVVFILAGSALLQRFDWVFYVFGAFLVFTGVRLLFESGGETHPERNPVVRLFTRLVPMSHSYHGARFLVREGGRWLATPLLLVLVVVEATDVVFAVDSIPAIFAITLDPFIVFSSNMLAILGLRALYFLLAGVAERFHLLHYGLGLVLAFVGAKMLGEDFFHVPTVVSLAVVVALIGGAMAASLLARPPAVQAARAAKGESGE